MNEMLDFFLLLKFYLPQAKFYFITNDRREIILSKAIEKGILERDIIIESAKRNEVPEKLAVSDWGISFIKPSFSKTASSPTKMGEMFAMGIPLVVNDRVGDVKEICEQTGGGLCIHQFSNAEFTAAILNIRDGKVHTPEAIREASFTIYGLEHAIKRYTQIYENCLAKH